MSIFTPLCRLLMWYSHWLYRLKECCNAVLSWRTLLWLLVFSQLLSHIFYWRCGGWRHFHQQRLAVMHASNLAASFSCHRPSETAQLLVSDIRNDLISYGDSDKSMLTFFLDQLARLRVRATVLMLTCTSYCTKYASAPHPDMLWVDPQENWVHSILIVSKSGPHL
jgi:hypothetical protein